MVRYVLAILSLLVLTGCGVASERLTMVAPRLAIDQELAEDFAELFSDPDFIEIELVPNPDPELPGVAAVKSGHADLALVSNAESYDPRVSLIVPLYPTVLHIGYRAELPGNDLIELVTDRTVFAGPPGSTSREMLETAVKREGISPEDINYVTEGFDCSDVVVVFAPILPEIGERIRECGDYRLFSLGTPEDIGSGSAVDSVTLLNPKLEPFIIPSGTYRDLTPEPVVTLAVDKLVVARSDLGETTAYDLLGEVLRLKPALSVDNPGLFHQLSDNFDFSRSAFALHPGALAYLQRDEPNIYERYSGVAEVVVTLMIGLVSGIYAVFQIVNIRQKNRIDRFCRQVMDIRDALDESDGDDTRADAIRALKNLQDQAYDLMIHEKLAADESFRIFISLSNDTMADLEGRPRTSHA